jgi:hypothetical protein
MRINKFDSSELKKMTRIVKGESRFMSFHKIYITLFGDRVKSYILLHKYIEHKYRGIYCILQYKMFSYK